ncbi:hypothetical protein, partial [uncultured Paraglaciecola sp.]|uniref:hypothetical protein n=1 Tax=uncultured Paraglaciecola sp. TaxID=1765024 RepID=UPI002633D5A0
MVGLDAYGEAQKTIVEVYTGGYISPTTYEDAKYLSFALNSEGEERLKLSNEILKHKHIAVLADVGTGKTTLLQKLILDIGGFT